VALFEHPVGPSHRFQELHKRSVKPRARSRRISRWRAGSAPTAARTPSGVACLASGVRRAHADAWLDASRDRDVGHRGRRLVVLRGGRRRPPVHIRVLMRRRPGSGCPTALTARDIPARGSDQRSPEIGVWSSMLRQLLSRRSLPKPPSARLLTPFSSRCPLFARGAEVAHS
jgi:hypothetical protein